MTTPATDRRPPLVTRRRVVSTVVLVAAFAAVVVAFTISPEPEVPQRHRAVVAVSPLDGGTELRQTTISADLAADYSGLLQVDRVEIPEDQLDRLLTGGTRVSFTPGPGKEFTSFAPGRHCATVVFWPLGSTREAGSATYTWCFTLH